MWSGFSQEHLPDDLPENTLKMVQEYYFSITGTHLEVFTYFFSPSPSMNFAKKNQLLHSVNYSSN